MASPLGGWQGFFEQLGSFLESCDRQIDSASEEYCGFCQERLETCLSSLRHVQDVIESGPDNPDVHLTEPELQALTEYRSVVASLLEISQSLSQRSEARIDHIRASRAAYAYQSDTVGDGRRGRPRFDVSKDQLEYLSSLSFTWTEIASLLGVSRMTVYRRRRELNVLNQGEDISDAQLHSVVREIQVRSPNMGEVMILGQLRAQQYAVTRDRVRRVMRDLDPLNVSLRSPRGLTTRRPYSVPGPNSLWHIDGHHKLVRWRIVTHCGIDGFSRMIVFCKCSTNNRASTVYEHFLNATRQFGLPSRVRSDHGRENIMVAQHMLEHRGEGRGSMITGSSTHNQRIERLWRDLHRCVTQLFYRLFYHLEDRGLLDPLHETHLYALHYVYLPRINLALETFQRGWNHHSIRTEGNHSPHQLFVQGSLTLQRSGLVALDFAQQIDDSYGVAEEGLVTDESRVDVPESLFEMHHHTYEYLCQQVNPLVPSENYAIELYEQALQVIGDVLHH